MGVDRKLFISDRWRAEDVKEALESLYDVKVKYTSTHSPDYVIFLFTLGKDEHRQMNVHLNSEHGGFKGILISLGAHGQSEEILKSLASRLGGFYNHEDVNSTWEEYQYSASGNLEFLLKEAILNGKSDGSNIVEFQKYLDWSEQRRVDWNKKNTENINRMFSGTMRKTKKVSK